MKLLQREISEKDGEGEVKLRGEEPEDMWHVFNLMEKGDLVRTSTYRKVVKEGASGTSSVKKRINLTIKVEGTDFDVSAGVLRLKGKNVEKHADVQLGAYHTLELELNRAFSLRKQRWDAMHLERLDTATDVAKTADVAAVVLEDTGLAYICLITPHMTRVWAKVELNVPSKGSDGGGGGNLRGGFKAAKQRSGHAKAMNHFFDLITEAVLAHVDFGVVKVVLLASPGFTNDSLLQHMLARAEQRGGCDGGAEGEAYKALRANRAKFKLAHSSSGHKHALDEVLAEAGVAKMLADTKAADDVRAMESFFEMMGHCPERAYYGYNHVLRANEHLAIDTLLITDSLFRSDDIATRRRYVDLVESAKENGAQVAVFSALHVSGERLALVTGVAALLRFPLAEEEFEGLESSDDSESSDDEAVAAEIAAEVAALGAATAASAGEWQGALEDEEEDGEEDEEEDERADAERRAQAAAAAAADDVADMGF